MNKFSDDVIDAAAKEFIRYMTTTGGENAKWIYQLKNLLLSGYLDEARELVILKLAEGNACPFTQKIAAGLLKQATQRGPRGRRSFQRPKDWLYIGLRYTDLDEKRSWDRKIHTLTNEFNMGKTSIEDSVRFYLKVMRRAKEISGIDFIQLIASEN
ncbi:MAG: hypothetical protein VYB05_11065 [Pseudomonadota bacterium]|nr:hypothetical protein [Pseudomonadota bacterium]